MKNKLHPLEPSLSRHIELLKTVEIDDPDYEKKMDAWEEQRVRINNYLNFAEAN